MGKRLFSFGTVGGLAPNLSKAGIHIHSGTECNDAAKVGGHLFSEGDGFVLWRYSADRFGNGVVDLKTPKGSYTMSTGPTAVVDRCLVVHDDSKKRVGIGKIVCPSTSTTDCSAVIGPYPVSDPQVVASSSSTTKSTTTQPPVSVTSRTTASTKGKVSGAVTNMLISVSAVLAYCILAF